MRPSVSTIMHFPEPDKALPVREPREPREARPSLREGPASPAPRGKRWGLRLGIVLGVLSTSGAALGALHVRYLPSAQVLPGMMLDGERLPDGATEEQIRAVALAHARTRLDRTLELTAPGDPRPILTASYAELGLEVAVDDAVAQVLRLGKEGSLLARAELAEAARQGRIDVPLRVRVERSVGVPVLQRLKEAVDTQPVSARLDLEKHATVPEKEGRYLDVDTTLARVESEASAASGGATTLEAPFGTFAPRVTSDFLKSLDIGTVLAEYETSFSRGGDQKRRGKNIDNAAQKLDGLVISPGELVSFNDVVGERSEANGFQKSWEIFKGEMVEGVGGGTCQVASTLHAASFFSGFEVLERLPHSRPSAYIPMGLDSTVVYPGVDLKMRNPHPFPVVVHAKTDGNKLRVEILGKAKPVEVSFGRELVDTLPYKRKVVEDATLSGKKVMVKQHGIKGFRIKRTRLLKYAGGKERKEEATDLYPPTTEIWHVPVGFDVALLPALPSAEEDADLGGNPAPAPAAARTRSAPADPATASACADCTQAPDALEYVDGPGAHAPTSAQSNPTKTVWVRHAR